MEDAMPWRYSRLTTVAILAVLTAGAGPAGPVRAGAVDGAARPAATECTGDPLPSSAVTASLVRGGFTFTEGPTWVADPGYLLFSDMRAGSGAQNVQPSSIWRFTPPDTFEPFIADSGSNGLAVTADGTRIVAATHDQRSVSSFSLADRTRAVVASDYQGRHFNSPNDVTIAADGTVYFTDPNYQRGNRADEMAGMTGVFRVRNGQVELVDGSLSQPNGVALAPDGATLYVAATTANQIFRYPIGPDGSIGTRTQFATLSGPDGVTIDCAGNLYWASSNDGLVHVLAPSGRELGAISAGRSTTNVAFGGPDGRTLFVTSGSPASWSRPANFGIYSVRLNLPGNPY
jgi:gluconolactonase